MRVSTTSSVSFIAVEDATASPKPIADGKADIQTPLEEKQGQAYPSSSKSKTP